jgi:hypothetical protein
LAPAANYITSTARPREALAPVREERVQGLGDAKARDLPERDSNSRLDFSAPR